MKGTSRKAISAQRSASELECLLLLTGDLKFLPVQERDRLTSKVIEIEKMLASLIKKLRADS